MVQPTAVHQRRGSKQERKRLQADDHEANGRPRNRDLAIWSTNSPTPLRPYNAMFIIVAAFATILGLPGVHQSRRNGASSVVDTRRLLGPGKGRIREQSACISLGFSIRLKSRLNRRERWAPTNAGTIELARRKATRILDQRQRPARRREINCARRSAYFPVAKAAATAGIPFRASAGTSRRLASPTSAGGRS
jgi:hypothetical protein